MTAAIVLLAATAPAAERTVTSMDAGWQFRRGDVPSAGAADSDTGWDAVTLPHSYNGADGDDGGTYYRGPAIYRRALTLDRLPAGRRLWLQFDGAALATDVWVNGQSIGRHEGGHAAFRFDITRALRVGANRIVVRTDNSKLPAIAPLGGDFTVFGGLYRHVWLVEVPDAHIDLADYGGPGVYVATKALDHRAAMLEARVLVRNDGRRASRLPIQVVVHDAAGATVATASKAVRVRAGAGLSITLPLMIAQPHRWQGRRDPYLYRVTARVGAGDAVTVPLGLRTASVDPQRGFVLNGAPYPLHGVNLFHSGRPGRGLAVTDRDVVEDMQALGELGVTGVRLVHFQHPQAAYDEADRRGFAIWTEIGVNGVIDPGRPFADNAAQQMRELIRQNYNHPSVVMWGIGNEVYATTPDVTRVLKGVQAVARVEDASRPTVYAHCCQADDNAKAGVTDIIGFNRYFGWYPGQGGTIGAWADGFHAAHPTRAFAVSEYGAGASIRHQQLPPPVENVPESGWHPEQAQTRYHEDNWRQLRNRPYLFGTFVWVAFVLASDGRHEGDRPGINDKGLITYDRAVRKDAFYWYQANWSADPMIHLTDSRLTTRSEQTVPIRAFTNAAAATLTVNGRIVGTATTADHIVAWPAVSLQPGLNMISVVAKGSGVRDMMQLVRQPVSASGARAIPEPVAPMPPPAKSAAPPGQ
jgi:beta-galactosidase